MELREVADFTIRPRLLTIPGVAQVIPMGGEVRQYRVSPHPAALRALGVTYEQIEKALAQFGVNTGGGFTDQYSREYLIRNIGRTTNLDDLRNVVVATVNGGRSICARSPASNSPPRSSAATPATWASPPSWSPSRSSPTSIPSRLTPQDRGGARTDLRQPAARHQGRSDPVPAGQFHRDVDSTTSSGCCSKPPSSWPSCCSPSC